MASQSTGIQQLLAAEKKSAEKVAEARKRTCGLWIVLLSLQLGASFPVLGACKRHPSVHTSIPRDPWGFMFLVARPGVLDWGWGGGSYGK